MIERNSQYSRPVFSWPLPLSRKICTPEHLWLAFIVLLVVLSPQGFAQISPIKSDLGHSYYYTDHYEITIDRSVSDVWPVMVDLGGWIPGIKEANTKSPMAVQGERFKLYGHYFMDVVKVIPEKMVLLVNLPTSQNGEKTQGTAMITLSEENGKTLVSMMMNRIYLWPSNEKNSLREKRESKEHADYRHLMYNRDFLSRLKLLSETVE